MSVKFDLKNEPPTWANSVNESLMENWPEYINEHGKVGSENWWKNYDSGLISNSKELGVVSFIGKRQDSFNEEWDTVEIDRDCEVSEYDRLGYWKDDEIIIGAKVLVECFEISFQQKHGPMTFIFERLVQVVET